MSAHTAGPWAIDWNVSRIDVFSSDAATLIATIRRSTPSDGIDADARANARLIAAAPELLEALRNIVALDPATDSDSGRNEWGEAECFDKAQEIASTALARIGGAA